MTLSAKASAVAGDITFTAEEELAAYRAMLLIRRFEEKAGQLYALGAVHGSCPLSIGQEASIVGVTMATTAGDKVIAGTRNHGHMLALGIAPEPIMAELLGRKSGLSGGRGGSVHMFSKEHHFYGGHSIPGTAAQLGAGLAFAAKYAGSGEVCLCFFSDGAADKGRVHETYKICGEWKLPIVFIIDNNAAAPGPELAPAALPAPLAERGIPFAIPGEQVDGIDVRKARAAGRRAIGRARAGEGPTILEMLTYRYRGHGAPAPAKAAAAEKRRDETDPLAKSRSRILEESVAGEAKLKTIEKEVREIVNAAAGAAKASPAPEPHDLHTSVVP
jgi:pyruvate dehydrogenase E1 component alpha subunit